MSFKIFIPQELVDAWVTADKVDLVGETLTFRNSRISLWVVPGFYFDHVSGGIDEAHKLLGRAKTKAAVNALGAEAYMSSVIVGETAYDVETGFLARPVDSACTRQAVANALAEAGY
jgi:hypothetical protein